jgi:catechol 2,3-dioxygenase-like lactoylglutathione lyase family enzyme
MIRLRQVALVARDLETATDRLCELLGVEVVYRDPGVAEFGLHNTLMLVGDQFLEVVSPTRPGTTAGRLLDKRAADVTGYMAIYEVDDLDRRMEVVAEAGVRVVWQLDLPDIRGRHLHPGDVGGAIVSLDQPTPQGAWRWGGPGWHAHSHTSTVSAIAGVRVSATDPAAMAARWRSIDVAHSVAFQPVGGSTAQGEGIDVIEFVASDRDRAGEAHHLDGLLVRFV